MNKTFATLLLGLLSLLTPPTPATSQEADRLQSLFLAVEQSPGRSIEIELRAGEMSVFESMQRLAVKGLDLPRLDLIPHPQRALVTGLELELKKVAVSLQGVTVSELLKAAEARGMLSCAVYEAEKPGRPYTFYDLLLARKDPLTVQAGNQRVVLTPELFRFFSINPLSRFREGNYSRLAVIVHEPHSSRLGQFQMIEALGELLRSNAGQRFMFLVEGDFEQVDRTIPLQPWKGIVAQHPHPHALVPWMVDNYVIEGAFAFRLLREQDDISAFAIDDQGLLDKSPRQSDPAKLIAEIERLPVGEQEKDILKTLVLVAGQRISPEESKRVAQALDGLIKGVPKHAETFRQMKNELLAFQLASQRDVTMAKQIVRRMGEFPEVVPLIFSGNYHTPGLIELIRKDADVGDVAFLVVDVRGTFVDQGESERFQDALHDPAARLNALRPRKLATAPRSGDRAVVERLLERSSQRLSASLRQIAASSPAGSKRTDDLIRILYRSPLLQRAKIDFGGAEPPAPPGHSSVAVFEPGEGGGQPRLYIHRPPNKSTDDLKPLMELIARNLTVVPAFKSKDLRTDKAGGRDFSILIAPEGRKVYFCEGPEAGPLGLLIDPRSAEEKQVDIRLHSVTEFSRTRCVRQAA